MVHSRKLQRIKNNCHSPPPLKQLHRPLRKPLRHKPLKKHLNRRPLSLRHRKQPEMQVQKDGSLASLVAHPALEKHSGMIQMAYICGFKSPGIPVSISLGLLFTFFLLLCSFSSHCWLVLHLYIYICPIE